MGFASAMESSLNHNRRSRESKSYFDKKGKSKKSKRERRSTLLNKKANPEELELLRENLLAEARKNLIMKSTIAVVLASVIALIFYVTLL